MNKLRSRLGWGVVLLLALYVAVVAGCARQVPSNMAEKMERANPNDRFIHLVAGQADPSPSSMHLDHSKGHDHVTWINESGQAATIQFADWPFDPASKPLNLTFTIEAGKSSDRYLIAPDAATRGPEYRYRVTFTGAGLPLPTTTDSLPIPGGPDVIIDD